MANEEAVNDTCEKESQNLIEVMKEAMDALDDDASEKVIYRFDSEGNKVSLAHTVVGSLARLWNLEHVLLTTALAGLRQSTKNPEELKVQQDMLRNLASTAYRMILVLAAAPGDVAGSDDMKEGSRIQLELRALFSSKDGKPLSAEEQLDEALKLIKKVMPEGSPDLGH